MSALDDVIQYHEDNCQSGTECDLSGLSRAELAALRATVAEQARQLSAARELLITLDWNDWDKRVDDWLAANPAPQEQKQR